MEASIEQLPFDVKTYLLQYFSRKDLYTIRRLNKHFDALVLKYFPNEPYVQYRKLTIDVHPNGHIFYDILDYDERVFSFPRKRNATLKIMRILANPFVRFDDIRVYFAYYSEEIMTNGAIELINFFASHQHLFHPFLNCAIWDLDLKIPKSVIRQLFETVSCGATFKLNAGYGEPYLFTVDYSGIMEFRNIVLSPGCPINWESVFKFLHKRCGQSISIYLPRTTAFFKEPDYVTFVNKAIDIFKHSTESNNFMLVCKQQFENLITYPRPLCYNNATTAEILEIKYEAQQILQTNLSTLGQLTVMITRQPDMIKSSNHVPNKRMCK